MPTPAETTLVSLHTDLCGVTRARFAARMSWWALRHAVRRLWPLLVASVIAVTLEVAWFVEMAGVRVWGIASPMLVYGSAGAGIAVGFLGLMFAVSSALWWRLLDRGDWIVVADPDAVIALHRLEQGRWRAQNHMARPGTRESGKRLRSRIWQKIAPDLHSQDLTLEARPANRRVAGLYLADAAEYGLTLHSGPRRWPLVWREVLTTATPATQQAWRAG